MIDIAVATYAKGYIDCLDLHEKDFDLKVFKQLAIKFFINKFPLEDIEIAFKDWEFGLKNYMKENANF